MGSYSVFWEFFLSFLAFIWFLIVYWVLKKLKFKFDINFLKTILSFSLIGISTRLLEDAHVLPTSFFTVTPGIWIIFIPLGFFMLYFSRKIYGENYDRVCWINALIASFIFSLVFLNRKGINFSVFFCLLPLFPILFIKDVELMLFLFFSSLDSIVPLFATHYFGYGELHPLSEFLLNTLPVSYPTLRIFGSLLIFYLLKKYIEDYKAPLYFLILISFCTSIRSFLRVLLMI